MCFFLNFANFIHFDHEAHAELLQTVRNEINGTDMRNTFETHEQNVNGVKSEGIFIHRILLKQLHRNFLKINDD